MTENTIKFKNTELKLHLRDEADISVMREIFKLHEYRLVDETIISATDPIVDVGAHAGFFSLYVRVLNNDVSIFAIEPEPENLKSLDRHLKENKIKKVKVLAGALASESGQRFLEISEDSHNHQLLSRREGKNEDNIKVEVFSLADFCKKEKIKRISLLKMDIEGGEFEVLKNLSAKNFFLFKNLILEYHNDEFSDHHDLENILRENGFSVEIHPSHFDKSMGFIFARNKRI